MNFSIYDKLLNNIQSNIKLVKKIKSNSKIIKKQSKKYIKLKCEYDGISSKYDDLNLKYELINCLFKQSNEKIFELITQNVVLKNEIKIAKNRDDELVKLTCDNNGFINISYSNGKTLKFEIVHDLSNYECYICYSKYNILKLVCNHDICLSCVLNNYSKEVMKTCGICRKSFEIK